MSIVHKVKEGETLSKIAVKYKVTVPQILKANAKLIKDVDRIECGWLINIPNVSKPSEPVTKDYEAIGKAFEEVLNDLEKLPSFQRWLNVI